MVLCFQLFAIYVLIHGHLSPGGGFQAGVLLGAGAILAGLVAGRRAIPRPRAALLSVIAGLALYGGLGAAAPLLGRPYLDYGALPGTGDESRRRYLGILGIEVGVTLAVAGAVILLFHALSTEPERP
jgi:multicomponent Na+:H+ antiporter subunit B